MVLATASFLANVLRKEILNTNSVNILILTMLLPTSPLLVVVALILCSSINMENRLPCRHALDDQSLATLTTISPFLFTSIQQTGTSRNPNSNCKCLNRTNERTTCISTSSVAPTFYRAYALQFRRKVECFTTRSGTAQRVFDDVLEHCT